MRGDWSLSTLLRDLLPAGTPVPSSRGAEITLEHLATHTSGLPDSPIPVAAGIAEMLRGRDPYAHLTEDGLLAALGRAQLKRTPGTGRIHYSDLGMGVLGVALGHALGGRTSTSSRSASACRSAWWTRRSTAISVRSRGRVWRRDIGVAGNRPVLGGVAAASLDTGARITAGEARRLACGAGIIPAVLGGASEVIDLGRTRRSHTKAQRVALGLRDKGCTADGCDLPPAACHAHHDEPWSAGGSTNLEDGRLLCHRHHRLIHDTHYDTTHLPHGKVTFHRRG